MNNKEFFNKLAFKWDTISKHDGKKLNKIVSLSSIKNNSTILDVGTGTGVLIKYLLDTNPKEIIALDIAENMISIAKHKYNDTRVEFIISDIMDYNKKGFDYVFLYSVYPHLKYKKALFKHLYDIINKGGKLIIAHSESKEKINKVHSKSEEVREHKLPAAEVTADMMKNYFKVKYMIDDNEMYYILAMKL